MSTLIDDCNWEHITAELESRFPDDYQIVGVRHYITWIDFIAIRMINEDSSPSEIAQYMLDKLIALDHYPIWNENAYSEREYEQYSKAMRESLVWGIDKAYNKYGYDFIGINPDSLLEYIIRYYDHDYQIAWDHEGYFDPDIVVELAIDYCSEQAGIPALFAFYGI